MLKGGCGQGRRRRLTSSQSVYAALVGDVLVVITKWIAALVTGSAAMTSEAVHSMVDTGNDVLLLYGMHRSTRRADPLHPFGYGREVYFWSFIVALLVFALGAGFSIYEGVVRIIEPKPIAAPLINYLVLALSFVFEGAAWVVSWRQFRGAKGKLGLFEAFTLSKDPPAFVVLFEDSAALLGLVIAAAGTVASVAFKHPQFDGIASVAIGVVLAITALLLARESKSLLIGEQAHPEVRASILAIANAEPGILKANGLLTVQLAPDQVVAFLSLEFSEGMIALEIESAVATLEDHIRADQPHIVGLFVKPQTQVSFTEGRAARLVALSEGPNARWMIEFGDV